MQQNLIVNHYQRFQIVKASKIEGNPHTARPCPVQEVFIDTTFWSKYLHHEGCLLLFIPITLIPTHMLGNHRYQPCKHNCHGCTMSVMLAWLHRYISMSGTNRNNLMLLDPLFCLESIMILEDTHYQEQKARNECYKLAQHSSMGRAFEIVLGVYYIQLTKSIKKLATQIVKYIGQQATFSLFPSLRGTAVQPRVQ